MHASTHTFPSLLTQMSLYSNFLSGVSFWTGAREVSAGCNTNSLWVVWIKKSIIGPCLNLFNWLDLCRLDKIKKCQNMRFSLLWYIVCVCHNNITRIYNHYVNAAVKHIKVTIPSNSAWPTPTMMMDMGSLAPCRGVKKHFFLNKHVHISKERRDACPLYHWPKACITVYQTL